MSYLLLVLIVMQPKEDDPPRLQDELRRLEQELERLTLENVRLKMAATNDPDARLALIRDEALGSRHAAVALYGLEEAAKIPSPRFKDLALSVGRLAQHAAPELAGRAVEVLSKVTELAVAQSALQDAADHPNADVRQRVALALRTVQTPAAMEVLVGLLGDGSVDVRKAAAVAAAEHPGPVAGRALFERLPVEPDPGVLEKLIDGLGELRAREAAESLIVHLDSAQENIVWASINALGKMKATEAGGKLLAFVEPGRPESLRLIAIQAVGQLGTAAGRRRLVELLAADREARVRRACASALAASGDASLASGPLLEALVAESEEAAREAIWKAMLDLTEAGAGARLGLLRSLIDKKRGAEAALLCGRLHDARLSDEERRAALPLERAVADSLFTAGSLKEALPHYRALAAAAASPEAAVAERVLECSRAAGEPDEALRFLKNEFKRARGDAPDRWAVGELAAMLSKEREDAFARTRTLYDLMHPNPAAPPEETRKRWKASYDAAVAEVRVALLSATPDVRNQALSGAGALRDAIILPLADWIAADGTAEEHKVYLYVGNAIARTSFASEIVADPQKRAEAARAWRAWHESR